MTLSYDIPKVDFSRLADPVSEIIYLPETNCRLQSQVSLADFTSFRVGGLAEWYGEPNSLEELQSILEWARESGLPIYFLGAGSNLLVSDRGISGLVISTRHLKTTHFDPETGRVRAGAGVSLPKLAWQVAKRGWRGLEWAVGIPGTVGGAVVMNAGAHQACTADILFDTQIITLGGDLAILTPDQLGYGYRTSLLQRQSKLVTQATLQLQPGYNKTEVMTTTAEHRAQRQATQPYHLPSCGSVFRNPQAYSAAWLIEQTGLKGYRIGDAEVAHRHANFILNCGRAKAGDIWRLIHHIQEQVEIKWRVKLVPEVKILGDFSQLQKGVTQDLPKELPRSY